MKRFVSADKICQRFAKKGIKITCKILDDFILIEGDKKSLEFIGNLIIAQANSKDCGFFLMPKGAGKKFFSVTSKKGIYIHRKPCKDRILKPVVKNILVRGK